MSNIIDFLKPTKSLDSDSLTSASESQVIKDKPSLFDSLLSGNKSDTTANLNNTEEINPKSKLEQTKSDVKIDIEKKEDNSDLLQNEEETKIDLKKDLNSKDTSVLKEEKISSTSSLLDRLVLEAKKEVKTVNQEQLKSLDNKIVSTQNLNNTEEITSDLKSELKANDLIKTVNNVEIKTSNQEESKSLDNKTNSTQNLNNTEEINSDIEEKEKIKNPLNLIDNKKTSQSDLNQEINIINQKELESLDNKSNTTITVNLNNIEEINPESKLEQTKSDVKTGVGDKEETQKDLDLAKDLNSKNTNTLKEEKISSTSSLLDRLVLEAKKEVKNIDQEQLKSLDKKITSTQNVDNIEEITSDLKINLLSTDQKEEIVKAKETFSSVKEIKIVNQEELNILDKNLVYQDKDQNKNSDSSLINPNKKIDIENKNISNISLVAKVPVLDEEKVKIEKTKNEVEEKIISFENNEKINTEINMESNIDDIGIDFDKNSEINNSKISEENISNVNKIGISNTISIPLSDTLNLDESIISSKNTQAKSLMDQLIQKNSENIESILPDKIDIIQRESASKDFISNIYLSTQKNSINTQNLFNKNEAVNLLKDASNIKDVKTSAQMLDLGLEDISVDQLSETEITVEKPVKQTLDLVAKKAILDSLLISKNIVDVDVKNLITKSVEASSALLDDTLKISDDTVVNVNSPLSYNIQSKIIGARQQMSTMMSDIARQMYENYKPPVTVFKINLNPLELGSIAILMKNDKNNSLSISMNVSNNTTLDALIDNQNVLKTSLNKSFDENTKFNLNFSSSNENNNQSSNQNNQGNQGNQNKFEQQIDTQSILELKEENKDTEEKSIDYM
ncbi:flagellar hook-length control protein FliK [Arcobacter sp. s6]|uniref:flagellar hook-length control protein FliK n=1 Tax=Arcobacter sp. s6 TaxID=3230363 RepID=UPI0034A05F11